MKYMLLTYLDEKAWLALTPDQQRAEMMACEPHIQKLMEKKKILAGAPLHPTAMATTIKYRDGKRITLDGPFAETREQLGGYTIIEAENLDEALDIARGFCGESTLATIEVRPIVNLEGSDVKAV